MVIIVIAEPRTGSTNLANWFSAKKNFTVLQEPIANLRAKDFKNGITPFRWEYQTEHLFVKDILGNGLHFNELISISDRVILLYRENEEEQIESWLNAKVEGTWHQQWIYKELESKEEEEAFKKVKRRFKEEYLDKDFFKISYEELYYRDGFEKVLEYIGIEDLKNKGFPYGKKYRVNSEEEIKIDLKDENRKPKFI